jgi:DNA polymerase III subunit alpha
MTDYEKLMTLCYGRLKGISDQDEQTALAYGECGEQPEEDIYFLPASEEECRVRLDLELQEIKRKEEAWMFLRFFKAVQKNVIQPIQNNEHNLFIWYLLEVCPSVNFEKPPLYTEGDTPDIDVDFHPIVREYLKDDFSFQQYGKDHVCNIMTYQTYGIKSSLIDVARVLDKNREEIISITTKMGLKDDDGGDLTFESLEETFKKIEEKEKRKNNLTKYEQIAKMLSLYAKEHPDVWDVAKRLVAASDIEWKDKYNYGKPPHRKKSMGLHASAVIISNAKLAEFVPLVVPPGSREKGLQACAWVEGLADTDCSSVGLIKFDYLSLEANAKVAECNRLIMERHGLDSFYALPGLSNWSDISYLNDPKSLEMANAGDLKGIFQFDSAGIRKMVKKGGVTSFDDLMAYSSLYRPGCLDANLDGEYCDRKNSRKEFEIHPLLLPILGKTYGLALYQEQIMQLLHVIGDIPLKDCEAVRKAISKKKVDKIAPYREKFIENGQKKLGVGFEYVEKMFDEVELWSGYGFNKCLAGSTTVFDYVRNDYVTLERLEEEFIEGDPIVVLNSFVDGDLVLDEVVDVFETGEKDIYEIEMDNGIVVRCTLDHKFLCADNEFHTVQEIMKLNLEVLWNDAMLAYETS